MACFRPLLLYVSYVRLEKGIPSQDTIHKAHCLLGVSVVGLCCDEHLHYENSVVLEITPSGHSSYIIIYEYGHLEYTTFIDRESGQWTPQNQWYGIFFRELLQVLRRWCFASRFVSMEKGHVESRYTSERFVSFLGRGLGYIVLEHLHYKKRHGFSHQIMATRWLHIY